MRFVHETCPFNVLMIACSWHTLRSHNNPVSYPNNGVVATSHFMPRILV
jgi:hypothetical protein